jgi:microcystin-dependent protein
MDAFMGSIMICGFNFTPQNWGACNGATVQIMQNQALYSLLGVQFGGDGVNNFKLPDLQGRAPIHFSANHPMAQAFGQENMTLTQTQLPAHAHTLAEIQAGQTVTATATAVVNASDAQAALPRPTNNYLAKPWNGTAATMGYNNSKNVTMASDAVQVTVSPTFRANNLAIGNSGTGAAFSLAQPSLALNFVICLYGIYPTRD